MRQNNNSRAAHAETAASEPSIVIVDQRLQVVQTNSAAPTLFGEGDSASELFDALTADGESFDLPDAIQQVIYSRPLSGGQMVGRVDMVG